MNLVQYVCIFRLETPKIEQPVQKRINQEQCSMHATQQSGGLSAPRQPWVRLTAAFLCNHQRRSSKLAGYLVLLEKMECMIVENEIVDTGIGDDAIEVQQTPVLLRSDMDRPSWRSNTMLHLDMLSIELGVMHS